MRSLAANKLAQIETHLQEVIPCVTTLRDALKDLDALAKTASGQRAAAKDPCGSKRRAFIKQSPLTQTVDKEERTESMNNRKELNIWQLVKRRSA